MSVSDPTPSLAIQMETGAFVETYRQFALAVGAQTWHDQVRKLEAAIKGCPTLESFLRSEHQIAYALDLFGNALTQHGSFALPSHAARALYPAMSFAAQVLSMIRLYGQEKGDGFRRRAADALTNPDAMRGLRLEMTAATHFQRRGHVPDWPEQSGGCETFDLSVKTLGPLGLEVECKAISEDKGRAVHIEEALRFIDLLIKREVYEGVDGVLAVTLTLPKRLPKGNAQRAALADAVQHQIKQRAAARLPDGTDVRVMQFDKRLLEGFDPTDEAATRKLIQGVTKTSNRHGVLIGSEEGGAVAFAVQSEKDDSFLDATFDTLKDAAKRQLTRSKPGLVIAGFDGIAGDQLMSIASQDRDLSRPPSGLAVRVQDFLGAKHREHVIGAAFVSRGALMPREDGIVDSGGAAYCFFNDRSSVWTEEFRDIFRAGPHD